MARYQKPQKVVYLLGAGASQAEASMVNETVQILTRHIADGIRKKIDTKSYKQLFEVKNELTSETADVEQLITLYESTGMSRHFRIAKSLKKLFREEIIERIDRLPESFRPKLMEALIDMHSIANIGEELSGILTLNYDDFTEKAVLNVNGIVNYCLRIKNQIQSQGHDKHSISLIKLHGSFNWKSGFPISLTSPNSKKNVEDILWIPPGTIKKRDEYPFSLLWAKAREFLDCDVLRVIGCSLSRNDWELISLLYTTQRFNSRRKQYRIELIDYADIAEQKRNNYPYLRIDTILNMPEFREYLASSFLKEMIHQEALHQSFIDLVSSYNPNAPNIFEMWLRSKGDALTKRGYSIKTPKRIFEDFILER